MVGTSYLRVYEPLHAFPAVEQERWIARPEAGDGADGATSRRWLIAATLPDAQVQLDTEGAFFRRLGERVLVCPRRTRLRMLAGLLAFRTSVPEEVADAFVSEAEARRAAQELEDLGDRFPDLRSHILHANWHVPLRWFAAFHDDDRILTEDADGLRIRYESRLGDAVGRLERAADVLEGAWIEDGVTAAVRELVGWLREFNEDGLLELDYGTVAALLDADDLVDDRSAAEVQACLEALAGGDTARAAQTFATLGERWADLRGREVVN